MTTGHRSPTNIPVPLLAGQLLVEVCVRDEGQALADCLATQCGYAVLSVSVVDVVARRHDAGARRQHRHNAQGCAILAVERKAMNDMPPLDRPASRAKCNWPPTLLYNRVPMESAHNWPVRSTELAELTLTILSLCAMWKEFLTKLVGCNSMMGLLSTKS